VKGYKNLQAEAQFSPCVQGTRSSLKFVPCDLVTQRLLSIFGLAILTPNIVHSALQEMQ
jgi:hypothetical protein